MIVGQVKTCLSEYFIFQLSQQDSDVTPFIKRDEQCLVRGLSAWRVCGMQVEGIGEDDVQRLLKALLTAKNQSTIGLIFPPLTSLRIQGLEV